MGYHAHTFMSNESEKTIPVNPMLFRKTSSMKVVDIVAGFPLSTFGEWCACRYLCMGGVTALSDRGHVGA